MSVHHDCDVCGGCYRDGEGQDGCCSAQCADMALRIEEATSDAYARGWDEAIEATAKRFAQFEWLCLDHGGEEQERIVKLLLQLKKGGQE